MNRQERIMEDSIFFQAAIVGFKVNSWCNEKTSELFDL